MLRSFMGQNGSNLLMYKSSDFDDSFNLQKYLINFHTTVEGFFS